MADGAGSGAWTAPSSVITIPEANAFGTYVSAYTTGTGQAQSFSAGSWTQVNITNLGTNTASATLATNRITLPAGTYVVDACGYAIPTADAITLNGGGFSPGANITSATYTPTTVVARVKNVTDSSALLQGIPSYGNPSVKGEFTIASTKTISVEYQPSTVTHTNSYQISDTERLLNIFIWKIA